MLIRLSTGLKIAIPPIFFWESRWADLTIRSGSAFYPAHVTSKLCLELLAEGLGSTPCQTLADIGCGSGILGLCAARMGVSSVVGVDIDPRAIVISRENSVKNGLDRNSSWVVGTAAALHGPFDCVAANLPYLVLLDGFDNLAPLVAQEGLLILSGFHDIQMDAIDHLLSETSFEIEAMRSGDLSFYGIPPSGSFTWVAVRARKTRG